MDYKKKNTTKINLKNTKTSSIISGGHYHSLSWIVTVDILVPYFIFKKCALYYILYLK